MAFYPSWAYSGSSLIYQAHDGSGIPPPPNFHLIPIVELYTCTNPATTTSAWTTAKNSYNTLLHWDYACSVPAGQTSSAFLSASSDGAGISRRSKANPEACAHSVLDQGVALNSACFWCADAVISQDSFCGTDYWDDVCVSQVSQHCY